MRWFLLLGVVLFVLFLYTTAVPIDGEYQKEIIDEVSNTTSKSLVKSNTKEKNKVKVKHRKDGTTVTIIKNKLKSKTVKLDETDTYDQTNRTLINDDAIDSTSRTRETMDKIKEVDVITKSEREKIVRDANGNIISVETKTKEKEKEKKKEKKKEKTKTKTKKTKKKKSNGTGESKADETVEHCETSSKPVEPCHVIVTTTEIPCQ